MSQLRSEHLMQLTADFDEPQTIDGPHGPRRILYMTSGAFAGPKLVGKVLPRGADWASLRPDGVFQLDIRLTMQADEYGALNYVNSCGILDLPADKRDRIRKGERLPSSEYYFRTALQFETGAEPYGWLNRLLAVGVGTRTPTGMSTEVFALI